MFIKIPFWRKVKRNPFSILPLALNICDFVLSFFHINLLSSTWDNEPPEGRSWVLHRSGTPGTCQNPSVRAEDEDEAKCYDWITYNTGDWKGHSTVLIPQPWTLHLLRTHTHTTLIYFTLNGNLHENSGLFFCVDLIRPWYRLSAEKMLLKCTGEPHLPWLVFAKTFCVNEQKGQEWTCFPEERKAQGCS